MNTPSAATRHDSRLAQELQNYCTKAVGLPQAARASFPGSELWAAVAQTGTSLWLDTGDIDAARELWTRDFQALTTNNTLLNKEVQKGLYDELVPDAAALIRSIDAGMAPTDIVREIAFSLNAVHGLKLVRTFDADVSVELHTAVANDVEASVEYGKRYHAICPDRFIVKVPLTPAGLIAARRLGAENIRVNFTLGFGARQNYLAALVAKPTYVNVFMGRINAFLANNELGDGVNAGEKASLSSQQTIKRLRDNPGIGVNQIGASIRSGQQCLDLLGLDVFTMPTAAAKQLLDKNPPLDLIRDRTQDEPRVTFAPDADYSKDKLETFWVVSDTFERAMCKLIGQDLDDMTPDSLTAFLDDHGAGDLFPKLSASEQQKIRDESKIPVYKSWRDRVRKGQASWDGLLTAAALASFASDQEALDERISGLI